MEHGSTLKSSFFIKYVFDIQNWKKGKRLFGAMQRSHGKAIKQIILICPPTGGEQQYNACIKLWLHLLQYFSCQGIIEVWVYFTSHGKDSSLVEFAAMKLVINFMPHFSFRMFAVLHSIQTAFPQNKITHILATTFPSELCAINWIQ